MIKISNEFMPNICGACSWKDRVIDKHAAISGISGSLFARFIDTQFLSENALTEQAWPKTMFEYSLQNMQLSRFMGESDDSVIQVNKDLSVASGNKVTFRLAMPLTGSGGYDDSDIEENEEKMNFHNFPVEVHERSNGVKAKGIMTEQYTSLDIKREAIRALGRWDAEIKDDDLTYALCGLGNQNSYVGEGTSNIETVNEKTPSANRIFFGGQAVGSTTINSVATDALLTGTVTNYQLGLQVISMLKRKAIMAAPKFRAPITVHGKKYFLMLIHPLQTKSLRAGTTTSSWTQIQANANIRGVKNPLFGEILDGAVGIFDGVILYEYDRLPTRVAGEVFTESDILDSAITDGTYRVARGLFLGAQAGAIAYARMPRRLEKNFDYGRKPGTATDMVYGVSRTQFRDPGADQDTNTAQEDYACFCFDNVVIED